MSEVPYDRELLVKVLIYHPACDADGGCHCGWGEWGQSHAEHVATAYETAVLARTGRERPVPPWEPTGWWRTTLPDGTLWTESSNEAEVREHRDRTDQPTTLWRQERQVAQRWVVVEGGSPL